MAKVRYNRRRVRRPGKSPANRSGVGGKTNFTLTSVLIHRYLINCVCINEAFDRHSPISYRATGMPATQFRHRLYVAGNWAVLWVILPNRLRKDE
jgi:hypothetical protein